MMEAAKILVYLLLSCVANGNNCTFDTPLSAYQAKFVIISAGFDGELVQEAMNLSWCESDWLPTKLGDNGAAKGLFQIHWRYETERIPGMFHGWQPWASEVHAFPDHLWYNPVANARLAYLIYQRDGWKQWTTKPNPDDPYCNPAYRAWEWPEQGAMVVRLRNINMFKRVHAKGRCDATRGHQRTCPAHTQEVF